MWERNQADMVRYKPASLEIKPNLSTDKNVALFYSFVAGNGPHF
jgi:hypothetical protein